ncbi:unnamed protein product [Caenorhabditis brenneri]
MLSTSADLDSVEDMSDAEGTSRCYKKRFNDWNQRWLRRTERREAYDANFKLRTLQNNADAAKRKNESRIKELNVQLQKVDGKLQELKYETSNNVGAINIQRAALIRKDEEIKNEREAHQMAFQNLQDQLDEANKKFADKDTGIFLNSSYIQYFCLTFSSQSSSQQDPRPAQCDQSDKLKENNTKQESQLKTVREEIEKVASEAETLEASIEEKDAEIANLKKIVGATKKYGRRRWKLQRKIISWKSNGTSSR